MFKGGTNTSSLTKPHGINVSQSVYGKAVKLVYGTTLSTPDLVWYNDWQANDNPTNSALWLVVGGGGSGKKSGKSSKKSGTKYYSATLDLVLGHAPIRNVLSAYYNNQKLAVVRCSASGVVAGGKFTFIPVGGNSGVIYNGNVPATGPYTVTVSNFVSDLNAVSAAAIPLQPAAYPPGAGQYSVDDAGNYSFNAAQHGDILVIYYRATGSGSAAVLAGIVGCTVAERFSASFNDFGGPGLVEVFGTWERPLWDAGYAVPGRIDAGAYRARDPYSWWWAGNHSDPTIYFPPGLEGLPITVYYGVPAIYKSDGTFGTSTDTPLQLLNLELEPAFASGAEYAAHPGQQLIQNWVTGLGSVRFDLGAANAMPNLNLETVGTFVLWPSGDCDPADIIIDILASGPVLVQLAPQNYTSTTPVTPSGTGTVSGVVTDQSTGLPVSGATVSYSGGSTTTAADGSWSFSSVAYGTYTFTVSDTGYTTYAKSIYVVGAGANTLFNVSLAPTGSGSGGGGVGSGSWVAINNIQSSSAWEQDGSLGDTGGGGGTHGSWSKTANGDGSETFAVVPASAYDDYYWRIPNIAGHPTATPKQFKYHMEFMYPTGSLAKSQGFEFQLQFSDGHYTYNMAWGAYNSWHYFHYIGHAGGAWIDSGIPVNAVENSYMIVDALFDLDPVAGTVTHDTLTLNGATHKIGVTQAAIAKYQSHYLDPAIQLDSKKIYQPFEVKVKANVLWLP
jgi:hypothetical protein